MSANVPDGGTLAPTSSESWFLPNLQVPLASIVDHLTCPICMSILKQCAMTPCGEPLAHAVGRPSIHILTF